MLRGIRLKLASKNDMKRIIKHVRGAVILHNFLRRDEFGDDGGDWLDLTDTQEGGDDLEPEPGMATNQADNRRRDELYYYLSELEDTAIN